MAMAMTNAFAVLAVALVLLGAVINDARYTMGFKWMGLGWISMAISVYISGGIDTGPVFFAVLGICFLATPEKRAWDAPETPTPWLFWRTKRIPYGPREPRMKVNVPTPWGVKAMNARARGEEPPPAPFLENLEKKPDKKD